MEFACGFQRSSIFSGGEVSRGFPAPDVADLRIASRLRFKHGRKFGGRCVVRQRVVSRLSQHSKGNELFVAVGCKPNVLVSGIYDGRGLVLRPPVDCFDSLRKVSRGGVRLQCQSNDSLAYIDGNGRNVDFLESPGAETENLEKVEDTGNADSLSAEDEQAENGDTPDLEELKESLQKAIRELEAAQLNSTMFEEKAQNISEAAIALKDEAELAWVEVNNTLDNIQEVENEESIAKEAVQKSTMSLSSAEARLQEAMESLDAAKGGATGTASTSSGDVDGVNSVTDGEEALKAAQDDVRECRENLAKCEEELKRLHSKREELQKEVDRLSEVAEKAQIDFLKAEEEVANIMLLAEQAVAFELEATQRVNDAEIALQKAEKLIASSQGYSSEGNQGQGSDVDAVSEDEKLSQIVAGDDAVIENDHDLNEPDSPSDNINPSSENLNQSDDSSDDENGTVKSGSLVDAEVDTEKLRNLVQSQKQDAHKDLNRESTAIAPKALLKKSSRFFSASFFSFAGDETEFTAASVFQGLIDYSREQLPKLVIALLLLGAGATFYAKRPDRSTELLQQSDVISTSIEDISLSTKPLVRQIRKLPERVKKLIDMLPHQEVNAEEASLFDVLWLLLASVIFVPLFQKIPGGSPVLGYLAAGILIGPYGLSIIRHVHGTKAIAEFGVVFLLFNIGLELSVERLSSMKKYVFGLGSAQVLVTAVVVGLITHFIAGQPVPAAIVIGNGLALSSTAVVLQVLQERGESTSRHGRATFSVLLFQDLAVVVLLILIPLISPNSSKGGVGFQAIAEALGLAALKAVVAITAIIAGGRLAGLSMALGAFLAGLLLAETEFSLQVESDIAPYRGLLLGLFFMTVGMSIDPKLLLSNFPVIMGSLGLLIGGKTILIALVGKLFGISIISAIRVGLLLAPGGEFAFVAFGDAVNQGIMSPQLSSLLFLVVGISMALTPYLAAGGQFIASRFEQHDVRSLLPVESETDDLQDHIIICGFGRVGQIIAQLLSERLIPFVALDVRSDRVALGRALDLPVYFGDAGSREVLHKVGAERACAAAITLDSPGANYRTVWALSKYFPNVKTFVRAHDVDHGLNLEKAGATAVVPETLEPSLQLAAAVLAQAKLPMSEIAATINEFRSRHLSELTELCETSGSSLGYGYSRTVTKSKTQSSDSSNENQATEGTLAV
uniref:RCK N-terminal domain-containing protein n=1 Tax=Kalanchoe fedtschenkoi TaxID=63787 RepID=A0A7N0SZ78_KALFE